MAINNQTSIFWIENLPLLTDLVVAVAAVVTASIAVYGVTSWKRELKLQTKHKAAAKFKTQARKLERELKTLRSPMFYSIETPPDYDWHSRSKSKKTEGPVHAYILQNRLRRLGPAFADFEQASVEAEAILGEKFEATFHELFMVQITAESCFQRLAPDFLKFFDPEDRFDIKAIDFFQAKPDGSDIRSKAYERQFRDLEAMLDAYI